VLVRVSASGVNPSGTKIRAGKAAHSKQPLPAVLGLDMAGIVEDVGPAGAGFKPEDAVYGMVGGVGGSQGSLAESIAADADLLAHKSQSLSMLQAAAFSATERIEFSARLLLSSRRVFREAPPLKIFLSPWNKCADKGSCHM